MSSIIGYDCTMPSNVIDGGEVLEHQRQVFLALKVCYSALCWLLSKLFLTFLNFVVVILVMKCLMHLKLNYDTKFDKKQILIGSSLKQLFWHD